MGEIAKPHLGAKREGHGTVGIFKVVVVAKSSHSNREKYVEFKGYFKIRR